MGKKKILLVEDEAVTAMDLKSDLLDLGYEVPSIVVSGEEALRAAAALRPDLVLMDIKLAGPMSGIEAADKITRDLAIPIVFLTAHTDGETIGKVKATEPFGYLSKPCATSTLVSTIETAIYKSEAHAARLKAEEELKRVREAHVEALRKARNLEALGVLAGGIAHDFNNLLQGLLGNITLARMYIPESSKAFTFLEKAEKLFAQATKLTGQLVAFSSGGNTMRMNIQPATLIRETITPGLSGPDITTEFNAAGDLCLVNVDPVQLRQIVEQMVTNAREAMPSGGRLRVTVANEHLPATAHALAPGDYVRISIQDEGCGISSQALPRIFDPYFSTKPRGARKGMGLGLSLCDTIIKKHGGAITVETEPGKGSTFHIHLPAVVTAAQQAETTREEGGKGSHILIMDDDFDVVQVATNFLRLSGFRVDSAPNGQAAIKAYQMALEAGDPYAVVILDLTIPGSMGGKEVVAVLKKIDPEVKAVVSSGYANDPVITDFADYGFVAACAKPYRLAELKGLLARFI